MQPPSQTPHVSKIAFPPHSPEQSRYKHEKTCLERDEEEFNQLKNLIVNKDEIIEELKKQIEVLLTKVGNNTTTTNNNTINININAFGKENLDLCLMGYPYHQLFFH